ncbi:DNA-binding response regulator, OmpR family, contains REC and winged-helix (wHTH) domain [Amycolatopsis arida]|uniref:DNA-binding response regulator, OmpR family, contains REC and winged-helix (WHTH) domain n=1 Tax=Amycolatopsis arida TaxID=587909 RepID=A0A1I5ZIW5_9PSEU|nr:response regulator transcription factor [Amycolatopsis arida]TDX89711.1 DNA-binding response OmpR family regulator [Amycolatopsis arida]SFQ56313.1 DNA-binding response regulator, OmpR family, contains REC and winged-helix (wHTH) domain [Amycolatopsis arida]
MRVLLVEDDDGVAGALAESLRSRGHDVVRVVRGADALTRHRDADLLLLDLGLPDVDGFTVLHRVRAVSEVPILVLTARGDERSVVRGLHLGADDYLAKPIRLAELMARIDAVVRRGTHRGHGDRPAAPVRVGDVEIDVAARRVTAGGAEVVLTPKEFDVLAVLAARPGTAVSRQQLLDQVWGDAHLAVSRSLDVHVTQLRAKLNRPGLLVTIRGFGYRLGS